MDKLKITLDKLNELMIANCTTNKLVPLLPKGYLHCIDCGMFILGYDKGGSPTGGTLCGIEKVGRLAYSNICSAFRGVKDGN